MIVPEDLRWTGELERGMVVVNGLQKRGRRLGLDVFEQVREQVPLDLAGMESAELGGLGAIPLLDLWAMETKYRFFFNPIRYTSLGLAVCEAMMLGMPIIGLATTEMVTAVQNGVNGYVDTNVDTPDRAHAAAARGSERGRRAEQGRAAHRPRALRHRALRPRLGRSRSEFVAGQRTGRARHRSRRPAVARTRLSELSQACRSIAMTRRIAFISEHASPLGNLGGADGGGQNVYVAQLAKHLAALGYEVDVFTRRDRRDLPEIVNWIDRVRIIHVEAGPASFVRKEDMLPLHGRVPRVDAASSSAVRKSATT